MLRKYYRTYYLREINQADNRVIANKGHKTGSMGKNAVYSWDDFTAARSPIILTKSLASETITSEWQSFCTIALLLA